MVRLVLVATLLAGCYTPEIGDCVDRCGQSGICPDDLACVEGFCRIEGAVGTCSAQGQTTDAPAADNCPAVPIQQGCSPIGPLPRAPYCMVACVAKTGTMSLAFHVGSWHAAVIGSSAELADAMAATNGSPAWLGLTQAAGQSSPDAGWSWVNGAPMPFTPWAQSQPDDGTGTENAVEQCGVLVGDTWLDEPCSASNVFLIEPY